MEEKFSRYDPTEYLTSEAEINAYLNEAIDIGVPILLSVALADIAEARTTGNEQECDEIDWTVKSK